MAKGEMSNIRECAGCWWRPKPIKANGPWMDLIPHLKT